MSHKFAVTNAPVLEPIAQRWSPRAFDPAHTLQEHHLLSAFEAARWAPSAGNTQPWRFILAERGSDGFERITEQLQGANPVWAASASALMVNIAQTHNVEGNKLPWAVYDLGQSVAYFTLQAHSDGLHVHQMGGFDAEGIAAAFELPEHHEVVSVAAIGRLGDPTTSTLTERQLETELATRERLPIEEVVTFAK